MLKKINLTDLHKSIKDKLEDKTKLKCYDVVPLNAKGPFLVLQCVGKQDNSTKTMYVEDFIFYVQAFSPNESSKGIYELIQLVEEALTEDIALSEDFNLISQVEDGILQILTEQETKEKRAVIQYTFKICYGFKCKI